MIYTENKINEILNWLKNNLDEERYVHSIGVAECAIDLAKQYNQDTEKAYVAGLLHDCAKCFPFEKSKKIAENNLELDECEKNNKKTIHAPISSYVAKTEFGINDKIILSAIRWHTIGNINMSTFDKIIFLADKIEYKTREEAYAKPLRYALKDKGLDFAIMISYKQTIKSLVDRNLEICTSTIDIYNKLLKQAIIK